MKFDKALITIMSWELVMIGLNVSKMIIDLKLKYCIHLLKNQYFYKVYTNPILINIDQKNTNHINLLPRN